MRHIVHRAWFISHLGVENISGNSIPSGYVGGSRRKRTGQVFRYRFPTLVIVMLVTFLSGSLAGAEVQNPESKTAHAVTVVKPDFAFFKGKTITYIVPNTAGTTAATQIVAMQSALEQYLDATINIEYVPGSQAIGQDDVGASVPDGLVIGTLVIPPDLDAIYANAGTLSFPLLKASLVGSTFTTPDLEVGCTGSPSITSFAQLIQGNTPAMVVNITNSGASEVQHLVMGAYGIPHKYINGYTAASSVVGCQRGDGNIAFEGINNLVSASGTTLVPGITPLLLTGLVPNASPASFLNSEVPTIAAFAKQHSPKTPAGKEAIKLAIAAFTTSSPQYATFGPPGIPKTRLLALTDAMKAVMKQASVKQNFIKIGIPPGFVPPESILSFLKVQIKHQSLIERFLNS